MLVDWVVAPLLHAYELPIVATRFTLPPVQNVVDPPATITAVGSALMVKIIWLVATAQGAPDGLLVVKVIVTDPAARSATDGVYTVLRTVVLPNVPVPEVDQVPIVADPPTLPAMVAVEPAQID